MLSGYTDEREKKSQNCRRALFARRSVTGEPVYHGGAEDTAKTISETSVSSVPLW